MEIEALILAYTFNLVGAIVILAVGWWASKKVSGLVARLLGRAERVDATLRDFFASVVRYLILIFVGFAVLDQFGIQTTSLLAVLGAAGLAVGLALQGTLSNVAAGVMLLMFRPFKAGDFVEVGGQLGTIVGVTLFTTELRAPDGVQIIAPNGQIWGSTVKNFSHHPTRRTDIDFAIAYEDDIDHAMAVIRGIVDADERILKDPEPFLRTTALGDSAVVLTLRVWANSPDLFNVRFDLIKNVKQAFDREGVTIPFPQRTVHLRQGAGE